MPRAEAEKYVEKKNKLNSIRNNISVFNKSEKPLKITKKLIAEEFLPKDEKQLAQFLH